MYKFKLKNNESGEIRRTSQDTLSFSTLERQALIFFGNVNGNGNGNGNGKIKLTYLDEEGDDILVSSDHELKVAYESMLIYQDPNLANKSETLLLKVTLLHSDPLEEPTQVPPSYEPFESSNDDTTGLFHRHPAQVSSSNQPLYPQNEPIYPTFVPPAPAPQSFPQPFPNQRHSHQNQHQHQNRNPHPRAQIPFFIPHLTFLSGLLWQIVDHPQTQLGIQQARDSFVEFWNNFNTPPRGWRSPPEARPPQSCCHFSVRKVLKFILITFLLTFFVLPLVSHLAWFAVIILKNVFWIIFYVSLIRLAFLIVRVASFRLGRTFFLF